MRKPWQHWRDDDDELSLRVLSQIVVAGNAAPGDTLRASQAARERLAFARLKKLSPHRRRQQIHSVLSAIGTRYVGKRSKNPKIDAAMHNFEVLVRAGGPGRFFQKVASMKQTKDKINFLSKTSGLKYFKKKGSRDILIGLGLASDCIALDQRITKILECVHAKIQGSLNSQYEQIEKELIKRVAEPNLSGGELDQILFRNYGDIMVRLLCP